MRFIEKFKSIPVAARASVWFVVCSLLQKGIAFVTTPIFTRLMSTEQYGQVTIFNSWLEIFMIFATLNLFYGVYNNALMKYPEERDVATSSMQGLCTTLTFIFFLLYLCFQKWINNLTGMSTLMTGVLFGEVLFVPAFRFWAARQRYEFKYRKLVILSLLISVLTPLLGVFAVLMSTEKGYAKIMTGVFSQIVISIALYIVIFKRGKTFYNKKFWKYALAFNIPLIPHYMSSTVLNQSDRVMIDKMCGTDKAGIYGLAYTIGALAIIFNEAIMNSFTPWTYQNLKNQNYKGIKKVTRYIVIFIAFLTVGLVALAPEIIWILGGSKYVKGVWIIAPISASIFFRFLYSLYANIEFYYEENYFIMIASIMCAILNIILNYMFIKIFGYLAAGFTTLVCFVAYSYAHFLFSFRVLKKHASGNEPYDNKFVFGVSLLVVVLCTGMMSLYDYVSIRYIIIAVFLCVAFTFRKRTLRLIMMLRKNETCEEIDHE